MKVVRWWLDGGGWMMGGDRWWWVEPLVVEVRRGCDAARVSRCGIFWFCACG